MDGRVESGRPRRPIRNKRYSRRAFGEDKRPPKRLFTPEIKRFLKDWLVRRRENPYPNRDEKKMLAVQTGLTYIQVCNWFANWRRKLKNAGREPQRKTWGDLIKTYNSQVQGNVEHFSICSEDSIWEEADNSDADSYSDHYKIEEKQQHSPSNNIENNHSTTMNPNKEIQNQCYFVSSTTPENDIAIDNNNPFTQQQNLNNKYKNNIMEKYLRNYQEPVDVQSKPSMISKWLESAVNFKPSESSYLDWTFQKEKTVKRVKDNKKSNGNGTMFQQMHGREELDAAEALTTLANARK